MALASRLLRLWLVLAAGGFVAAQRTPDEALQALQAGNHRFATEHSVPQPLGEGVRRTLARGQSPFAVVICCADSRVPPEHIFNAGLGELFVVRVAGECADAETIASIEYAVEHLNAPLCVVLGHEGCGAIAASVAQAINQKHDGESLVMQQMLEHIEPAVRKAQAMNLGGKDLTDACEEEHAQNTAHECLRRSELLRRYASIGKFRIVAARYHLDSGEVDWLPYRPLPAETKHDDDIVPGAIPTGVPPHVALRLLEAGHRRFLGDGLPSADLTATRREALTHGQHPLAIVVTCSDSRVAPEHVFDAGLGDLFVIRIAGNTLNDDALASIEYAAEHTGASLLVVMGHTKCGAITAAANNPAGQELSPNMRALLLRLEPSVAAAKAMGKGRDLIDLAVRNNALRTVAEARSRSELLRRLEAEGRFTMLASVYDIASGDLTWLKDKAEPAAVAKVTPNEHAEPGKHESAQGILHGPAEHTEPADGDNSHRVAAQHGLAASELPLLDWGNPEPMGETKAPSAGEPGEEHAEHAEHADEPAHEEHAEQDEHGEHSEQAAPDGHADAGEHPSLAEHEAPPALRWNDPTVLIGISGVGSLLAAAVLAMRGRR